MGKKRCGHNAPRWSFVKSRCPPSSVHLTFSGNFYPRQSLECILVFAFTVCQVFIISGDSDCRLSSFHHFWSFVCVLLSIASAVSAHVLFFDFLHLNKSKILKRVE